MRWWWCDDDDNIIIHLLIYFHTKNHSLDQLHRSLHLSAIARTSLISSIVLSLKVASDHNILQHKACIVLNLSIGLWALTGMYVTIRCLKIILSANWTHFCVCVCVCVFEILHDYFFSNYLWIVGIVQGCMNQAFSIRKALNMIMFSWPFLYKGYTSMHE